jgi:hypothetical protein
LFSRLRAAKKPLELMDAFGTGIDVLHRKKFRTWFSENHVLNFGAEDGI